MAEKLLTWAAGVYLSKRKEFMKTRNRITKSVSRPTHTSRPLLHSETRKNSIYNIHIYKYIMCTHSHRHIQSGRNKQNCDWTVARLSCKFLVCSRFLLTCRTASTPLPVMCSISSCCFTSQNVSFCNYQTVRVRLVCTLELLKISQTGLFKNGTLKPRLYSCAGDDKHTHFQALRQLKWLHSAMAVFVKTNVY